ncbi:MAG: hypothetical protein ABWX73_13775 [Marmoricola sp.]
MRRARLALAGLLLAALLPAVSGSPTPAGAATVPPWFGGCRMFPSDNFWNRDISKLNVHRLSSMWLGKMSTTRKLHPDFGPSYGDGPDYGIPITVVPSGHPKVSVAFDYASESDRVGYPFDANTRIEGGRDSGGDMHAVVIEQGTCRLYETWSTREQNGRWTAGSGATWNLNSNNLRPDTWTSADAAGLPILPGLLRWNEVKAGKVEHAIRFTTNVTSRHHLWPARHDAGSQATWAYPPMGARFRLKPGFSTAGFSTYARTVITAMKHYGLVLADNGSPWFVQGEQNAAWPPSLIDELKRIPANQFVAVETSNMRISANSAQSR